MIHTESYRLIQPFESETIEKGSRFLAFSFPCDDLDSFDEHLKMLQRRFSDASHHTYAYKIFDAEQLHIRCQDDGEPSGTAGRPILNHIEGRQLTQIAVIVIRYFGGVKLGAGGLVRAYGNAAKAVLPEDGIQAYIPQQILEVGVDYAQKASFDHHLKKLDASILKASFTDQVHYRIQIAKNLHPELLDLIHLHDAVLSEKP